MNYSNLHAITVPTFYHNEGILLGDFNTDYKAINSTIPMCQNLKKMLSMFDLKQLIGKPTRVTVTSATIIDLVLVSEPSTICQSGVTNLGLSDHMLTYRTRKVKTNHVCINITTLILDHSNITLKRHLESNCYGKIGMIYIVTAMSMRHG